MSKLDKAREKFRKRFNEGYAKVGKKLGFAVHEGKYEKLGDFSGGYFGRMNHVFSSGEVSIHVHSNALIFTAHGLMKSAVGEPLKCYCGLLMDKPVPATLYVKQIRSGLRKKPTWVPFHKDNQASEVFKAKMNWNNLLDLLNGDNELRNQLGKLNVENELNGIGKDLTVGRYNSLPVKVNDQENNHNTVAQIIPMGSRTLIAIQHVNEKPKDIEPALKIIQRIHRIINGYSYSTPTSGIKFRDWPDELLENIDPVQPKPVAPKTPLPPPAPSIETHAECNVCGAKNPIGNKFCGECGSTLIPQTATTPPPPPIEYPPVESKVHQVDPSDPYEQVVQRITGGRNVQWVVRTQQNGTEYERKLWNLANEGLSISFQEIRSMGTKIKEHDHYYLLTSMRHVKTPAGKAMTGGFMNFVAIFNKQAPHRFRNQSVQVLVLPRDDALGDTPVSLVASTDKEMNLEKFRDMLNVVLNHPRQVEEFYLIGIPD